MGDNPLDIFHGLTAVVQYRDKETGIAWRSMAAFDSQSIATKYRDDCASDGLPWEYRVVDVPEIAP